MKNSFEAIAESYFYSWLSHDRIYCQALQSNTNVEKLKGISAAANYYRVARNLPTKFDLGLGLRRYQPVLRILNGINPVTFSNNVERSILRIENRISSAYGEHGALSFSTKLLWVKMPGEVIIYDARARNALGARANDLAEYYKIWREEYSAQKKAIAIACKNLSSIAMCKSIKNISAKPWFQERVFDAFLWQQGNP